jgi:sterol desaturase/sphingolipid hydroxylase (fatty acid hydroxylase superfamily)
MDKALYPYLLFWSIGLLCVLAEWRFPARPIAYRSVFWRDLIALGLYNVSFLAVVQATDRIPIPNYMPAALYSLPTVVKLALFYIVEDFGLYWVHRLMHTKPVWRIHRWHHSPHLPVLACWNPCDHPAYRSVQPDLYHRPSATA